MGAASLPTSARAFSSAFIRLMPPIRAAKVVLVWDSRLPAASFCNMVGESGYTANRGKAAHFSSPSRLPELNTTVKMNQKRLSAYRRGTMGTPSKHILLIDDEDDIREVASMSLETVAGWRVTCAR